MHIKLRRWVHRCSTRVILCGLSMVLFAACSAPDTTGASGTQPTTSPVKAVSSPHPTVFLSPTQKKPSMSCNGYQEEDICIIDPQHFLNDQPASPDAITPITHDMALTIGFGRVIVSQKYGILYLTFSYEGTSSNDEGYCKNLIFSAFFVTEHDYLFPGTSITCYANKTTLIATLSKKTAKKIDWNTMLTVAEEAIIAWKQYDTRSEMT